MKISLKKLKEENFVEYQRRLAQLNANNKKWYEKHKHTEKYKEKRRIKQKNHYYRHPFIRIAKAIKKGDKTSLLNKFDIWKIAKRQRLICALTGRKLTYDNMSPDHIIPLSKNGTSTIENIRLVIKEVNLCRQTLTDDEFVKICMDVVKYNTKNN